MARARQNKSQSIKIKCRECRNTTNHDILYIDEQSGYEEDNGIAWSIKSSLVKCKGCDNVALHRHSLISDPTPETLDEVFPDPDVAREPLEDYYLLPKKLRNIYLETLKALEASQPILAGIGIRAIIETVCKERNAQGGNLENKIDDLSAQGVLTEDGAKLLHKLRIIGNKAAHEVKPHSTNELLLAMDVIHHLLLGVYILPEHANETFS